MLRPYKVILISICAGVVGSVLWFVLASHIGFDLGDEGYFWYGSQRIVHGEFPIRDFLAYDLGRYFYTAVFLHVLRDTGLMSVRIAAYSVIGILVTLTTYIIVDSAEKRNEVWQQVAFTSLTATLLGLLWVYPYYKAFDYTASILLVLSIYVVISKQNALAWHLLGICVGFIAVIGRNHGVYGVVASVLAFVLLFVRQRDRRPNARDAGGWCVGVILGYLPMLYALLFVDGFFDAFIAGVKETLRVGETNIPVPVPWPWTIDFRRQGFIVSVVPVAIGIGFLLLLAFPVFASVLVLRERVIKSTHAAFAASLCVSVPYVHYAFSRADLTHLALAMYPVVVGVLTIPIVINWNTRIALATLLIAYSTTALFNSPPINYWLRGGEWWTSIKVRDDGIIVTTPDAEALSHRIAVLESLPGATRSFLALPNMPALHAIFESRIPVYDIYVLSPALQSHEDLEILRLLGAAPDVIMISDHRLDSEEVRRFSNMRPVTYKWINNNYRRFVSSNGVGGDVIEIYTKW